MIFALLPASVHDLLVMAIAFPLGFVAGVVAVAEADRLVSRLML